MANVFSNVNKNLNEFWSNLDKRKRIGLIVISSVIVTVLIILIVILNRPEYSVLYNNLDSSDAGEILGKLTELKVNAKAQDSGTILVPKKDEAKVRMELAAAGYPKSSLNYDLYMKQNQFGSTDYDKQKVLMFQLQERLQSSIKTLDGVDDAIVTISMPDDSSFVISSDKQPATASVVLKLRNGFQIQNNQVSAIQQLMLKSVQGLKQENLSIIDTNMNVLNTQQNDNAQTANSQLSLENQVRDRLQKQVLSLLQPVFGNNNVLASVNVKLDFDKQTQQKVTFSPSLDDKGIAVSENNIKEQVTNANGNTNGVAGQTSNGAAPQYQTNAQGSGNYSKTDQTTNYDVNSIKETIDKAQGQVKQLSVSVIIDNNKLSGALKTSVQQLVAKAVGVDPGLIVVQGMTFNQNVNLKNQVNNALKTQQNIERSKMIKNIVIMGIIGVIIIVLIIMLFKIFKAKNEAEIGIPASETAGETASPGTESLRPDLAARQNETSEEGEDYETEDEPEEESVDDISIKEETTVKKQIDNFVKQKPEVVAQLLRNWLSDD